MSVVNKKYELSDDMADFMRADRTTRGEIMKKTWAYARKHDLKDERGFIHPDDVLSVLYGRKPFNSPMLMKAISKHIIK